MTLTSWPLVWRCHATTLIQTAYERGRTENIGTDRLAKSLSDTKNQVAAIWKLHHPQQHDKSLNKTWCYTCNTEWPCTTVQIIVGHSEAKEL